jgi:large subunit ribosomal protein L4
MKFDIYKTDGSVSGDKLELSDAIFGIEPNDHAIYLSVKAYLANHRQGTHKAKERSDVRGGGRKPWRQKGRGAARAGTIRSPIWIGGGTTFGPRPRNYRQDLPKKVKSVARKSAFSYKVKDEQLMIVQDFSFESPKTKEFLKILQALNAEGKRVLLLTGVTDSIIYKAGRNIPKVKVLEANKASTYDILNNQVLILQKSAAEVISKAFTDNRKTVN